MKIDRRLHLVVPIYGAEVPRLDTAGKPVLEDGKPVMDLPVTAYVHSTPLATEIVDRYFMILAQTYSAIFSKGLGIVGGPSIAARLLRETATEQKMWEDVRVGLMEEIRRLSLVIVPGDNGSGWQPVPIDVAVQRGLLDPEDRSEVENAIVFFIVASATLNRAMRRPILEAASALWGAQISSSNSTEFTNSLTTSTATVSSGEKPPAAAPVPAGPVTAVVDGKPSSIPV